MKTFIYMQTKKLNTKNLRLSSLQLPFAGNSDLLFMFPLLCHPPYRYLLLHSFLCYASLFPTGCNYLPNILPASAIFQLNDASRKASSTLEKKIKILQLYSDVIGFLECFPPKMVLSNRNKLSEKSSSIYCHTV
jgi:hypothetical protein